MSNGFTVSKEINLGHVLTAITMLVAAILAYSAVRADVQMMNMNIETAKHESQLRDIKLQSQLDKTTYVLDTLINRMETE